MTLRRLFRAALAAALLSILSCGSTSAYAGRQRAVVHPVPNQEWARGAVANAAPGSPKSRLMTAYE